MIVQIGALIILLGSVYTYSLPTYFNETKKNSGNISYDGLTAFELIEKANADLGKKPDDPEVLFGDIAVPTGLQNADPCTRRGCLWDKAKDGKVYVPYTISTIYSLQERSTITQAMQSFASSTCIRFIPAKKSHRNYLRIESDHGCYSMLGRQSSPQVLSLNRNGCVALQVVQHELLHALGFHHEQNRSDRDKHVRIMFENIEPEYFSQFTKTKTNNLRTKYDYNSIMHYRKDAFSKNGRPSIVPIPNPNASIGLATRMSVNDILRVNRLYKCKT